jgi:pimeloyl-ACP methyl ester carboxylesterase
MTATKRHYVEVAPGIELYVEETGAGRPIVFIPGWTGTTEVFARQVPHFADRYRVVTFDPRCHGRSTKTVNGISYRQQGRDLATLIEKLDLANAVFVPWSYGCLCYWEYVDQFGLGTSAGAIFIDQSPLNYSRTANDWSDGEIDAQLASHRRFAEDLRGATRTIMAWMWQKPPSEEALDWCIDQSLKTPHYAASLFAADGLARDETKIAETTDAKVPVLHVVSEENGEKARRWLVRHCPSARLEAFGGHIMFWEFPDRFNAVVDAFLADNGL